MLPLTIDILNHNAIAATSPTHISLNDLLEKHGSQPIQSTFNRNARLPSMLSNIFLWLTFLSTIGILHLDRNQISTIARIIYGLLMLIIIIVCYIFILIESKGCLEQILLKKRVQLDLIKRDLAAIQKDPKLTSYLVVSATNYYNSFQRKYIDYQLYDQSLCQRIQSYFYHHTCLIESPFHIRFCHLTIPDFVIDSKYLCQISFQYHLSIVGRDAEIVHDDLDQEFQRLQMKLSHSLSSNPIASDRMNRLARIERKIYFQSSDLKQQEYFLGQRRSCLTYENRSSIRGRWFFTENTFWIMTCIGLSWLFRVIFHCFLRRIIVPVYIEFEGAMPLPVIPRTSNATH